MHKSNILFLIIRSGNITGLLSSRDSNGISEYHEIKKNIVFDNTKEHKSFDSETYKVLEEIIEASINKNLNLPLPDKVVCIYSSPWFVSQISEYSLPVIKKGFSYSSLKELASDAADLDDDVVLIEQNVESIILNGYKTNKPEGQKYTEGSSTFITSWILSDTKKGIESVIHKVLNDREIQHMTLPRIINTVVGSHNPSYHLIDIHGECTDIINVQEDNIDNIGSIPIGVHHLVRSIQKDGQDYHNAYEELGHIISDIKDPIDNRVEKEKIMQTLFLWSEALDKIPDFRANNNIILLSQNNTDKLFKDALNNNHGDHNSEVMILDKGYFNSEGSSLDLTSIAVISFWNILEKKGIKIDKY